MNHSTPTMRAIAEHLIAYDAIGNDRSELSGPAAFGAVIEKLRRPLAALMGGSGFQSLAARALALARDEVRWLRAVHVNPDGSLQHPVNMEQLDQHRIERGEVALLAQLLGLLVTFIGEALTWRLVEDVWPAAGIDKLISNKEAK